MNYAQIRYMDISNGEGIGVSLFVQGCKFYCYNCFNQETWDINGGKPFTDKTQKLFFDLIDHPYITRISFLGGSPLIDENVITINNLICQIKDVFPDKKIWLYTGFLYEDIVNAITEALGGKFYENFETLEGLPKLTAKRSVTTGGHFAYLKIAEGCNKRCTYCIIPYIRGNYRSVPMEELVAQAKELVAAGAKELILVAQETTLYGVDLYGEKSLHKLLDALNEIPGLFWIRIMYCYPEEIYEELIDAIARNEKVCHYLDLPIQHANDTMLKRMGRRTSNADLVRIITHLRERIPDITLRTTLICGFPGETKEMHEELMQFINDMEFDRLGAFTYSPEEGTPAAEFPDQIDEETKKEWQADVMELQEEIIFDKNEEMKGRELYVFIEGKVSDENAYIGRTYRDAPDVDGYIFINTDETLMTGDIVKVKVTGAYEYDLIGEICQ